MKIKDLREIWIESSKHGDGTYTMNIGSDWGCCTGFNKTEYKKLFDAISETIMKIIPDAVINPWSDSPYGTFDV